MAEDLIKVFVGVARHHLLGPLRLLRRLLRLLLRRLLRLLPRAADELARSMSATTCFDWFGAIAELAV